MTQRNRFWNADNIWHGGACNPRAVARVLVEAIDQACEEGQSSAACKTDPAVHLIIDHLCFLVGLPQPSLGVDHAAWSRELEECEKRARA